MHNFLFFLCVGFISFFVSTKVFLFDLSPVNYLIEKVAELSAADFVAVVSADCFVIAVAD